MRTTSSSCIGDPHAKIGDRLLPPACGRTAQAGELLVGQRDGDRRHPTSCPGRKVTSGAYHATRYGNKGRLEAAEEMTDGARAAANRLRRGPRGLNGSTSWVAAAPDPPPRTGSSRSTP